MAVEERIGEREHSNVCTALGEGLGLKSSARFLPAPPGREQQGTAGPEEGWLKH